MEKTVETFAGDTPGTSWQLTVLRFRGSDPVATKAYLHAALHGDELPGIAALHYLIPQIAEAERNGTLRGDVTIVPYSNPIGLSQELFGQNQGRFGLGSRVNFNRDFPLRDRPGLAGLVPADALVSAEIRIKSRLLALADGHDIVLDLHCDDEGPNYLYVPRQLWPHMADLAVALGARAVLTWRDTSDAAFEEAAFAPYARLDDSDPRLKNIAISTVELRGMADVSPALGRQDADGLFWFLKARGVIAGALAASTPFGGPVVPLENVDMIRAPIGGAILYHVRPGDTVWAGDPLVSIIHAPGEPGGETLIHAPQDGLILTRRTRRLARINDFLLKLLCASPSATARPGSLEP